MFGRNVERPRFTRTPTHVEALNRLLYLVETESPFAVIRGESGSGRTSVLQQLRDQLSRQQIHCSLMNAAGMDAEALLWHLVAAFSLDLSGRRSRAELLMAVRDELQGRAHCGLRSVIILDDLDMGCGDFETAARFLTATAGQAGGGMTVVMAASSLSLDPLTLDPGLLVELPRLSRSESFDFARQLLTSTPGNAHLLHASALPIIAELAGGSPRRLTRICQLLQVVQETSPTLAIDDHVVREVAMEVLPRAVA